jgi:hypothetical protein
MEISLTGPDYRITFVRWYVDVELTDSSSTLAANGRPSVTLNIIVDLTILNWFFFSFELSLRTGDDQGVRFSLDPYV